MDYDFGTLPLHIIANILLHLSMRDIKNASQTCKTWYYASWDTRIVNRTILHFITEQPESMDIFVRPVTKLWFQYLNFKTFDYKKLIQNFGHQITELHIYSCDSLRITQLYEMFIYLSNLKILQLHYGNQYFRANNFFKHKRITRNMARIKQNLSRVQELHIRTAEKKLKGVEILLNHCTTLKTLHWNEHYLENLDFYKILFDRSKNCIHESVESLTIHSIDRNGNSKFFEQLTNLNHTKLRSLSLKEISNTYYDVMFKQFCKTYSSLQKLTMYGCNDLQLADICKYMRKLKILTLEGVAITNFTYISYLNKLENLNYYRTAAVDNSLIELFRLKPTSLRELTLNIIDGVLLKEICENLPQLQRLSLEYIVTKECEPIFRHLTKLKQIHLQFAEFSTINSKFMKSDPEWNVTKLIDLEDLYLNIFLPGFTPDLIAKLPNLKTKHHEYIYDAPTIDNGNQNDENIIVEIRNEDPIYLEESIVGNNEDDETLEFHLTDFNFYPIWFCDNDI